MKEPEHGIHNHSVTVVQTCAMQMSDAGNNDTTGFLNVSNGVHSVGEVNGTSSPNTLADYDSEISCTDNTTKTAAGGAGMKTTALKYGDKVTCTITNHRKARLEVVKKLDPAADNGTFNLQIDSATKKAEAGHNDTTGFLNVADGVPFVGEVNGTSSPNTLADYDSEISCTDNTT